MDSHAWQQIISSAVVPVVIISACGLLCLAFYNRLASIISRLRTLQRERLTEYKELFALEKGHELQRGEVELRLRFLEQQTAEVLKKAHHIRNAIACLIGAIGALILSSLAIGVSLFFPLFDIPVLFFFVVGLVLLICALVYAFAEVAMSLNPIRMECAFLQQLIEAINRK